MEGTSAMDRRRAARQRKILENAQSRMNRLYGREDDDELTPHIDRESPVPAASAEHCPDPPDQSIDEVLGRSQAAVPGWPAGMPAPNMEDLFRQMNGQATAGAGTAGHSATPGPELSVWWRRWDNHRWVVISLLAVMTRLAVLAGVNTALTQNVLVPFFVLEAAVYVIRLWSFPLRTNMGMLGTALMLCGVSPRTLDLWGRYVTFLIQAWSDFMIYLFVLVLSFWCGGAALAADAGTTASDERPEVAAPPPPLDDALEFEF